MFGMYGGKSQQDIACMCSITVTLTVLNSNFRITLYYWILNSDAGHRFNTGGVKHVIYGSWWIILAQTERADISAFCWSLQTRWRGTKLSESSFKNKLSWIAWLDSEHDDSQWKATRLQREDYNLWVSEILYRWYQSWLNDVRQVWCVCLFLLDTRRCVDKCIIVLFLKGGGGVVGGWIHFLEETQVGHTHLHTCVHVYTRGHFFAQTYRCVRTHTPAVISVEAHERSLTTMRTHICASGTHTALWIWVALQDNKGRKKLSSRIRGITTKPTTAARINKAEQGFVTFKKWSTDSQTDWH